MGKTVQITTSSEVKSNKTKADLAYEQMLKEELEI